MIRPDEYWAGQADGDGSIRLYDSKGYPGPAFLFRTTCEMTVRAFFEDMGVGKFRYLHPPSSSKHAHWKPRWAFTAARRDTLSIVTRLYPYLIEKAARARDVLLYERVARPETLPRTDAYWAGLVDAEGHISLSANNGKRRPVLCVKMVDQATVTAMHQAMGIGSLNANWSPSARAAGHQPQWTYKVSTQKAIKIINRLRPFLLTKVADADRVLAYYLTNKAGDDKKLNREKREDIRRRYASGSDTQAALAFEYGVHHVTVSDICRFKVGRNDRQESP